MKLKNMDAMADFILKEAEAKESLRKRMSESAWEYYTGRYFFRSIMDLLFIGSLFYISINDHVSIPLWGLFPIAIALIALQESKRNTGRVDALIKLSELDSGTTNAAFKASPKQQDS
ncbi:MAG: hypothetical protein HN494_14940 [Opitutae bacterium]|jgi:hypothetical protein|nr:hypothetical protein [Opitutae bacterium]MBT5908259.1 hypothetical protein [Opitutae bacterium]MBT6851397.1 hypothetical protein [Opitutae bacterium]